MADRLDFGQREADYMADFYEQADVRRRRRLVLEALGASAGERVLDVGCGPGFYLADVGAQVGPTGAVTGIDRSTSMLAAATERCAHLTNVTVLEGSASTLPVEAESFDAVVSVQVMEYVQDVPGALTEIRRVLAPGGRVVLWDIDWSTVSWHSADPDRMGRVLDAWDAHLVHPSLPRTLGSMLEAAGFEGVSAKGHAFVNTGAAEGGYGAGVIPFIENFVANLPDIDRSELAAWSREQAELMRQGRFYFVCTQFCFTARRPS